MKIDIITTEGSPRKVTIADIENGVGGAELALLSWAETMAKRCHQIRIYNNPTYSGMYSGVEFLPVDRLDYSEERDVLIMFRGGVENFRRPEKTKKVIGWSCDQYTNKPDYREWYNTVDKMVLISEFHRQDHINRYNPDVEKMIVIDLGVRDEYKPTEKKKQMLYCSVPDRGLGLLLDMWPTINRKYPDYELVITSDYRLWGSPTPGNMQYRMKSIGLKNLRFLGKVPRSELVKIQSESELMIYPCNYDELFCIAAAECQVAGAFPITTNTGALETTNFTGYKIKYPNGNLTGEFLQKLDNYFKSDKNITTLARERFDWNKICGEWERLFE